MAEFFKNFSNKVKNVTNKTAEKTKQLARETKLNINLKTEEGNLEEVFHDLGEAFYNQAKSGKAENGKIADLILQADQIEDKIKKIKEEISVLGGKIYCPSCKKEIDKDIQFCPYCGAKIEAVTEEDKAETDSSQDNSVADNEEKEVPANEEDAEAPSEDK